MTPKKPKKAEEGPVSKHNNALYEMLCIGDAYICVYKDSWSEPNFLNNALINFLKTSSGNRWMEENGVGS
jgi:hypothetical protein